MLHKTTRSARLRHPGRRYAQVKIKKRKKQRQAKPTVNRASTPVSLDAARLKRRQAAYAACLPAATDDTFDANQQQPTPAITTHTAPHNTEWHHNENTDCQQTGAFVGKPINENNRRHFAASGLGGRKQMPIASTPTTVKPRSKP